MKKIIALFTPKPQLLFLLDGAGAALTAFLLFVVLRPFNEYIGLPRTMLTTLSAIALIFCTYSISCFLLSIKNWKPYLRIISVANLLYCLLTFALLIHHRQTVTALGIIYFLLETAIVAALVYIEVKAMTIIP